RSPPAIIDATARKSPSTVTTAPRSAAQIASGAMRADSRILFIRRQDGQPPPASPALRGVYLHCVAVYHAADGVVRSGDDLIARLKAAQHLEILVAGDAQLDGDELRTPVAHDEDAFGFLPRLSGLELGRGCHRLDAASTAFRIARPFYDLVVRVVHELPNRDRRNRH